MRLYFRAWVRLVLAVTLLCPVFSQAEVVVVPLKGEVSEAQFFFLRRAIKDAERKGAEAVVLDMDTYGGALNAAVKMQEALYRATIPTYTYINPNAGSAGALIALSTKSVYMAPVSAIGAAAPVLATGGDIPETMSDKLISYFSGYFRSAAERNGHNPDIAEAFINKEKEVKVGETIIHPKGSVLTLSAQEAVKVVEGRPLLAAGIAPDLNSLLAQAGLRGESRRVEPTGFEQLAFLVTALAPLFMLGGILGAYIEFKTPGFGVPGIISICCFILFFTGHYVAGLAGMEVLILFLIGVALVLSEILLHPGTILPGAIGVFLILGALLYAMVDRYPGQPILPSASMLVVPTLNLLIAGVLGAIGIAILAKFLPRTTIYHRIVLNAMEAQGPSLSATAPATQLQPGMEGETLSILRPSGRAKFGNLTIDVVTEGDFIAANLPIQIVAVEGARVVVQAAR